MEPTILSEIITSFGPAGGFVAYLIWSQMRRDAIDRDRIEADKLMAASIAALTETIKSWRH